MFGLRFLRSALAEGLDYFYPPLCMVCEQPSGPERNLVCPSCLDQLELIEEPIADGLKSYQYLDEVRSVFVYSDAVKTIIHYLKYQKATQLADLLAPYMVLLLNELPAWKSADYIVPVPLHPVKKRERGYNQSECIAKALSERINIPVRTDILRRRIYTISQTLTGSAEERQKNVKQAFALDSETEVKGKHIILVDDVVTTGATANACAALLKQTGAASVYLLTLAHPAFNS